MDSLQEIIQWPCELPNATKEAIVLSAMRIQQFGSATAPNRAMKGVIYIKRGIAAIGLTSEHTNTMNSGIFGTGNWLGGSMINHGSRILAHVEQIEPVEVIFFAKDKIDHLANNDPYIYKWLYHASISTQQQWLNAQVVSLHDRETRVIFALLQIAQHTKQVKGSKTAVHASQKQLSMITGISRPRLNEVLKMLEAKEEISVSRGVIHLLEPTKLSEQLRKLESSISNEA